MDSLLPVILVIQKVIIPRPILALDSVSGQCGGLGMITGPISKCPCINLYLKYKKENQIYLKEKLSIFFLNYRQTSMIVIVFIQLRDGVEGQYGSRDDNQANMEMPMY
jgi:hypothetical protein